MNLVDFVVFLISFIMYVIQISIGLIHFDFLWAGFSLVFDFVRLE